MIRTGVFATEEEAERLGRLARDTAKTPVIAVPDGQGGLLDASGLAREHLYKAVHAAARAHGLPEVPGWYGLDLGTREFLRSDDVS